MNIVEMMQFFEQCSEVVTIGICLCTHYVIKISFDFISDKYIPLIMVILGVALRISSAPLTPVNILSGMLSGLVSIRLYEPFKNHIIKGNSTDKQ